MLKFWSVNYTFILDMSKILDNIYVWVVLVNMESVLLLALVNICCVAILLKTLLCCTFSRLKIVILWRELVENLLIFVYLFCPKNGTTDFTKTFIIQEWKAARRKLPDPSLNSIFNALSIGVQYTLSFRWTNFGLKCLLEKLFQNRQSWHPFLIRCKLMKTYADVFLCCKLEKADFYKIVLLKTFK